MQVQFYHLLHTPLPQALLKLLEKALATGARVQVRVADAKEARRLSDALFSIEPAQFLPHGTADDAHAERQPVYITWRDENPNAATILVTTNGSRPLLDGCERLLDLFDGRDEQATQDARARWAEDKAKGIGLQYIRQQEAGGWKVEATA